MIIRLPFLPNLGLIFWAITIFLAEFYTVKLLIIVSSTQSIKLVFLLSIISS